MLINVYLPCTSACGWKDEYLETLACITNDIDNIQYSHIVCGGDFNIDFQSLHPCRSTVLSIMDDLSLHNVSDKLQSGVKCSFRVESTGASSLIDHFFVSTSLYDRVISVVMEDSGINLSDHCAVVMELNLPLDKFMDKPQSKHNYCYKWRWDKADVYNYYLRTFDYLSAVEPPLYLLYADSLHGIPKSDIQSAINGFYQSIVNALKCASLVCT